MTLVNLETISKATLIDSLQKEAKFIRNDIYIC